MVCQNCGAENKPEQQFCVNCGVALSNPPRVDTTSVGPLKKRGGIQPPQKKKKGKLFRRIILFAFALFVLLLLLVTIAIFVVYPRITGQSIFDLLNASDRIVVLFEPGGDKELVLLKLGKDQVDGTILAEDVSVLDSAFFRTLEGGKVGGNYGGFLPGSDLLLIWYLLDDEIIVQQMSPGDKEPMEVFDSKANYLVGTTVETPPFLFIQEFKDDSQRCYISKPGESADRVMKADQCFLSQDGSWVIFSEVDDGEITLAAVNNNDESESLLLDGIEGVVSYRISADVSHIASERIEDGKTKLYLSERDSGKETKLCEDILRLVDYGFAPSSDLLFYITEEKENNLGILRLYVSGEDKPLVEGKSLGASFTPDGQYLVYLLGDEQNEDTLSIYPISGGEVIEVLSGGKIGYQLLETTPPVILARFTSDNESSLYGISASDGSKTELLNEGDASLQGIFYVKNEPSYFISTINKDSEVSLFFVPKADAEVIRLLDEWATIQVLNRSFDAKNLVFQAREDQEDDPVLYSIAIEAGADPIELDDDNEAYPNAVFTSDGKHVLYTIATGDDLDDIEVHQVRSDGSEKSEILYEEAALVEVEWDSLNPWTTASVNDWESTTETSFGNRIVFVSDREGQDDIFVMNIDGNDVIRLSDFPVSDWGPVWSPDGQYIGFISGEYGSNQDIWVVKADGSKRIRITDSPEEVWDIVWSPDGQRLAFISTPEGKGDIFVANADGSNRLNLTNSESDEWAPTWSPDGQYILFVSDRDGDAEIYTMNKDGSNQIRLTYRDTEEFYPRWSPDGRWIGFESNPTDDYSFTDIYLMDANCINKPVTCEDSIVQLTKDQGLNWIYDWSPDGGQILISSDRSGITQIYAIDVNGLNTRQLTDRSTNSYPGWPQAWSANGNYIVFFSEIDGDTEIFVMDANGDNVVQLTNNDSKDSSPNIWP